MLRMSTGYLRGLTNSYKIYIVSRRPGLPPGYSLSDMSDDYAVMIKDELGGAADIIGVSTGGTIAQHFAIDHPDLVRRLVLAMTGFRLNTEAKELQMEVADTFSDGLCGCWALSWSLPTPRTGLWKLKQRTAMT
jgi:pimeloyl-ACP methyl ester carboxylesterase